MSIFELEKQVIRSFFKKQCYLLNGIYGGNKHDIKEGIMSFHITSKFLCCRA